MNNLRKQGETSMNVIKRAETPAKKALVRRSLWESRTIERDVIPFPTVKREDGSMLKRLMSHLFPPQRARRAVLTGEHGRTVLEEQSLTIGRTNSSQLTVKGPTVSRRHAELRFEKGEYFLCDTGSAQGSKLNGQRLVPHQPYRLKHGDRIFLGEAELTFLTEVIPDEGTPPEENETTGMEQDQEQVGPSSPSAPVRSYKVWKQGRAVLAFTTEPGYLVSVAFRSSNDPLPRHPFLRASSLNALTEHELSFILRHATSVEDFIWLLHGQGFEVVDEATGVPLPPSIPLEEWSEATEGLSEAPRLSYKQGFEVVDEATGNVSGISHGNPFSPPAPGVGQRGTAEESPETLHLAEGSIHNGRYQVEKLVAVGGMGAIYRALDTRRARSCALQEILDDGINDAERAQKMKQFGREAELLLDLNHPGLPRFRDFFTEEGKYYLLTDFPEGQMLGEMMKGGPITEIRARHFAHQLCSLLACLHRQSPPIMYGDLNPSHVIVTNHDELQVIGLGLLGVFQPRLQATETMMPGYVPPEQWHGMPELRSDLYALGAILHHLLTGHDAVNNQPNIFSFPSVRSLRPGIAPAFDKIVMKALAPDLEQRWSSAEEMERAMMGFLPKF